MGISNIGTNDFDEVVKASDRPVLVDFWADWCGPCRPLAAVLEKLAEETDAVEIVKVNVDQHPELGRRYSVLSLPTLVVFVDGVERKRLVGARPLGVLKRELEEVTAKHPV